MASKAQDRSEKLGGSNVAMYDGVAIGPAASRTSGFQAARDLCHRAQRELFSMAPVGTDAREMNCGNARRSDRLGPGGMTRGRGALGRFSAVLLVMVVIAASGCDRTEVSQGDRDRPETSDLERALSAQGMTGSVALVQTDGGIRARGLW